MTTQKIPSSGLGIDEAPLNSFHKKLALYSAGGPFLDGFIIASIGVAMVQISPQLHLTASQEGLLGASILFGMLFGAYAGGWLTDVFGRKVLYTVDLTAIVVLSVAQFWADSFWWLFALRILVGVAVGADYPIATSLLTEFTPLKHRGQLISFLMVMMFVGAGLASFVGEMFIHLAGEDGWRWTLASAALPAALIVALRAGTPESPRWLLSKGRVDEAQAAMRKAFGPDATLSAIDDTPAARLLGSGYLGRMVFVTVIWTCSLIPVYAIYAFGPAILAKIGLNGSMANYASALINTLFLAGCVLAMITINRYGRRPLIIASFFLSGLALLVLGLFPSAPSYVLFGMLAAYAVFIGGAQVLQWVYPNELFPTSIRASAVGMACSLSRIGGAVGIYAVPPMIAKFGIGPTMLAAAALSLIAMFYSIVAAPETRGKTLAETSSL
ncbi:MFS transporter [Tsukamurella asaccharolytica]|uniref:MFS transporter n=1 Tax=Tsukamurella asaccharolytica TaxID=2592067 RepID=A0A5C5RDY6_9ACTN|nr:MFS transporter [Tsukamurella asaccharolytica]TWS20878.1 MFS transporter [Tsukamurella asaccharolytica]